MIIGISGKKQHGKDTVANIIQYLMFDKKYPEHSHNLNSFSLSSNNWKDLESGWRRKQFASKLKQIVALLIGCTVDQLEDNKFKETPLGEEWRYWYWYNYKLKLGGHSGRVSELFNSEQEAIIAHPAWSSDNVKLTSELHTPRSLLQLIGTEAGRKLVHPNIWVNALMADYKQITPSNLVLTNLVPQYLDWIVTDVRFPNELTAIEDRGGIVIRANRPNPDRTCLNCYHWWFLTSKDDRKGPCPKCGSFNHACVLHESDEHESETALDNHKFKHTITNNGSIEELVDNVGIVL